MAETAAAPRAARARPDEAVVRRVRVRLLLLSGGSTLAVLVALGALLYATVATSLTAAAIDQLRARSAALAEGIAFADTVDFRPADVLTSVPALPGVMLGGPTSGTFAIVVDPERGAIVPPAGVAMRQIVGDLAPGSITRALAGEAVVTETDIAGTPVRVLSEAVTTSRGPVVTQVVGDRTAELRTLGILLVVLLVGGLAALAAALALGWIYAERALVPIRDAMRRQREFAADASHELRTPLAVVKASVEHLRRHAGEPVAAVGTALDDIDAEVDRLATLVDDLLLLARSDSGAVPLDRRPADLAELVLDAAPSLAALGARHGRMVVIDAAPVTIEADPGRLRQLLAILVDNGVRHARAGGEVRVTVREASAGARLVVEDDGAGIAPEHLPHVFDRFWRAPDAPPGGTGLGLAIAAWIVGRHGGSIEAGNRPDGGARFTVLLPAG